MTGRRGPDPSPHILRRPRRVLSLVLLILFFMPAGGRGGEAPPGEDPLALLRRDPTITHRQELPLAVPAGALAFLLDNPAVLGRLWKAYNLQPAYEITTRDASIHLHDPSGITVDLTAQDRTGNARTFFGRGRVNHWAVPSFFTADALATISHRRGPEGQKVEVRIVMRGRNAPSRLAMRIFSGLLERLMEGRIRNNLADLERMVQDLRAHPQEARQRLRGEDLAAAEALLKAAE
ncbi:MAG TPA: hypothetical protein PK836_00755 [Syntrophales bacterium]|nr:hypothetical protein [Syntrophales bacterium]HPC00190.1 hypothetical protein [Syntrophales bacterium]HRS86984.1 hypothetical protein [Syntrophales bacterium]